MTRLTAFCLFVGAASACSGRIDHHGAPSGSPEAAPSSDDAPMDSDPSDSGTTADVADGADASDVSDIRARSGRVLCDDERDCIGSSEREPLPCVSKTLAESRVCARPCFVNGDCRADELCVPDPSIRASCFHRCEWPQDCSHGFDCFDYFRTGDYLCIPGEWALDWTP